MFHIRKIAAYPKAYTHTHCCQFGIYYLITNWTAGGEVHEQIDTFVIHFNILLIFFPIARFTPAFSDHYLPRTRNNRIWNDAIFKKKLITMHTHPWMLPKKNNRRQWRLKCFLSMLLITIFNAYNLNWFHRTLNSAHAFRMNEIEIFGFFFGA